MTKQKETPGQVIMDLPDFIPEEYKLNFSISGHKYRVEYEEAHVDEVLKMMMLGQEGEEDTDYLERQRKTVTEFLTKHCKEGDKDQLKKDLNKVPYTSKRDSLSILQLLSKINMRDTKKKEDTENQPEE